MAVLAVGDLEDFVSLVCKRVKSAGFYEQTFSRDEGVGHIVSLRLPFLGDFESVFTVLPSETEGVSAEGMIRLVHSRHERAVLEVLTQAGEAAANRLSIEDAVDDDDDDGDCP